MSDYGAKVSVSGSDVKTAPDTSLILNSKYPFLKAFAQGSFSVNVTGPGTFSGVITHNLGYFPAFLHLGAPDPNNPARRYTGRTAANGPGGAIAIDSYITTSDLTIGWRDTSASPGGFRAYPYTVNFYYYIFYDELT